jgi:2-methylisocitrate lyase-like PEP mutase family enzyme
MMREDPAVRSQQEKGELFARLHEGPATFFVPNPWDVGAARLLAYLGFDALATTGAGYAFSTGRPDGATRREEQLAYAASIASACDLPVTADLEDGYGDDPETVYATVLEAGRLGLVGASIEDRSYGCLRRRAGQRAYDIDLAAQRVAAAAEAARSLPYPFVLTARCENFLIGRPDLGDTIARLQRYESAGADCLYAPGLVSSAQIREVVAAVGRPVNTVMGLAGESLSLAELAALGVRRVSLGSTLARAAFGAFISAARELKTTGTCSFLEGTVPYNEIDDIFAASPEPDPVVS